MTDLTQFEQWKRTRRAAQKQLRRAFPGYTLGRVVKFKQRERERLAAEKLGAQSADRRS